MENTRWIRFRTEPGNALNVAIITNLFPPIQTGSAYWAQELAGSLTRAGDHVIVITCGPDPTVTVEKQGDVLVYRLPTVRHLSRRDLFLNFDQFYLLWSRANVHHTLSILREHRIELVHQCGQLLDSIALTRQVCRRLDLPAVCSIHTKVFHPGSRVWDALFRAVDQVVVGRLMKGFNMVLALDGVIADYVETVYRPKRLAIVPVCIDAGITREPPADPSSNGTAHVLSLGHVTEMRSRRELLTAMADLRRTGRDIRLTVAGKILTTKAQALADTLGLSSQVRLIGEVRRGPRLFDLFRSAHLEAHWLDMPGIGTAALEAMALGLPVLTYGYEGIYGDVPLRHGENIMFVDPRSPHTVLAALQTLVEEPQLRARMGQMARRLVEEHLTWDVVVQDIRLLYRQSLA